MASRICPGGNDFAIAVFFNEFAVADIIEIIALETHALFIFLDGSTIALTILKGTVELRTIGIAGDTLTIDFAILELAFEHIACLRSKFAFAVGLIGFPETYVLIAVFPYHRALAVLVALEELPRVFVAIGIFRDTRSRALTVDVVAFVDIAILELIDTTAILHIVLPLTDIHIA